MSTTFFQSVAYAPTRIKTVIIHTGNVCGEKASAEKGRTGGRGPRLLGKKSINLTCASECSHGQYENPSVRNDCKILGEKSTVRR